MKTITKHHVRMYAAAVASNEWFTNADLVGRSGVSNATAVRFTNHLIAMEVAEKLEIKPAPLFRLLPLTSLSAGARAYVEAIQARQTALAAITN